MLGLSYEIWVVAGVAVVFTGIAKAGFGGGIGILTTPLMALVIPPKESIGIMLPILCACDLAAIWHYRRMWDRRNVALLLPGAAAGIVLGAMLLGKINDHWLGFLIGLIAVGFVVRHFWVEARRGADDLAFTPTLPTGSAFGFAGGVTSTLAHAAGPVTVMFLLPQRMDRMRFVGTTVVYFTAVNAMKLAPYFYLSLINSETIRVSAALLPFVPIGVYLGIWMNTRINETWFNRIVYVILLFAGLDLIQRNLLKLL